jgi:hypothetical protein
MLRTRKWIAVFGALVAFGCGSIEGDLSVGDYGSTRPLPDVDVLLVRQSDSLFAAMTNFCGDVKVNEVQRDADRKRLEQRAAMLKDSAAVVFGLEYQSPRWQRLINASTTAADSANAISIANADPVTVAEENAVQRVRTDSGGHFRMTDVRLGRYFVVPLARESEFAAVQWYPTRVWVGTTRLAAGTSDGAAGCYLPGVEAPVSSASR